MVVSPFDLSGLSNIHCECTELVEWGSNLTSGVGNPRLTKLQASMFAFPPYIGVVIGLILSDAWFIFSSLASKNARLGFKQSLGHFPYFWNVFSILSHYCGSLPHLTSSVRKGVECFGVQLQTRSLPCFTELHNQFYVNGVKVLPAIIFELLTPVALAHWICGDGSVQRHGLILCTDSFSVQEVVLLMNVLMVRYQLLCTLREHRKGQFRIYIRESSMPQLRTLVAKHMDSSMLYKIKA